MGLTTFSKSNFRTLRRWVRAKTFLFMRLKTSAFKNARALFCRILAMLHFLSLYLMFFINLFWYLSFYSWGKLGGVVLLSRIVLPKTSTVFKIRTIWLRVFTSLIFLIRVISLISFICLLSIKFYFEFTAFTLNSRIYCFLGLLMILKDYKSKRITVLTFFMNLCSYNVSICWKCFYKVSFRYPFIIKFYIKRSIGWTTSIILISDICLHFISKLTFLLLFLSLKLWKRYFKCVNRYKLCILIILRLVKNSFFLGI